MEVLLLSWQPESRCPGGRGVLGGVEAYSLALHGGGHGVPPLCGSHLCLPRLSLGGMACKLWEGGQGPS